MAMVLFVGPGPRRRSSCCLHTQAESCDRSHDWTNSRTSRIKIVPFHCNISKNEIYAKASIFKITKNWLIIFEIFFKQIEDMDNIYLFFKPEMVLI